VLGVITNNDAKAIKNTPGIGRRIFTEATMPYTEFQAISFLGSELRVVFTDADNQTIHVTPVIKRKSYMCMTLGGRELELECGYRRSYLVKEIKSEAVKK
jgi:hypothetical protein